MRSAVLLEDSRKQNLCKVCVAGQCPSNQDSTMTVQLPNHQCSTLSVATFEAGDRTQALRLSAYNDRHAAILFYTCKNVPYCE